MLTHQGQGHVMFSQAHQTASSSSQTLCGMNEGDIAVLPFGQVSMDMSKHEPRRLTRLYSQNGGFHLRILPDGTVCGGRDENNSYDILRMQAVSAGVVIIIGEITGRYLAMNKSGHLYGSTSLDDECYFVETYEENHYNTYFSQLYRWFVALKRNGKPKAGPDTYHGMWQTRLLKRLLVC
uniref:Fibroblast growth factor n=1 Tax=Gouania willdenowi TaxID=441366 RepID=A0A8C5HA17_GOUWI